MSLYKSRAPQTSDLAQAVRVRQAYDSFTYGIGIVTQARSCDTVYVHTEANKMAADLREARRNTRRIGKTLEGRSD